MKKTAVFLICVLAFSCLALAQDQKGTSASSRKQPSAISPAEGKIITASEIQWVDAPPALPAGAKIAVLDGDPNKKGPFTVRLQTPAGYKIQPHTHPTAERITVISGSFHLGMGDKFDQTAGREMSSGGFAVMPAGMKHFAWNDAEAIVQIHSEGPFEIKYVNPADDPRNTKK